MHNHYRLRQHVTGTNAQTTIDRVSEWLPPSMHTHPLDSSFIDFSSLGRGSSEGLKSACLYQRLANRNRNKQTPLQTNGKGAENTLDQCGTHKHRFGSMWTHIHKHVFELMRNTQTIVWTNVKHTQKRCGAMSSTTTLVWSYFNTYISRPASLWDTQTAVLRECELHRHWFGSIWDTLTPVWTNF